MMVLEPRYFSPDYVPGYFNTHDMRVQLLRPLHAKQHCRNPERRLIIFLTPLLPEC